MAKKKRYFVYSGSLGTVNAVFVDETRKNLYFMFRQDGDYRWYWSIQPKICLEYELQEESLFDCVKKTLNNPQPIFMEFEGRSAEKFGLIRDSEALIASLERR